MLPVKALTKNSYQSHRAEHKKVSTRFRPMRSTQKDTCRDRVKQHTNNKEQLNRKEYKNSLKSIRQHMVYTQVNKDSKQLGRPPPTIAGPTPPRFAPLVSTTEN